MAEAAVHVAGGNAALMHARPPAESAAAMDADSARQSEAVRPAEEPPAPVEKTTVFGTMHAESGAAPGPLRAPEEAAAPQDTGLGACHGDGMVDVRCDLLVAVRPLPYE